MKGTRAEGRRPKAGHKRPVTPTRANAATASLVMAKLQMESDMVLHPSTASSPAAAESPRGGPVPFSPTSGNVVPSLVAFEPKVTANVVQTSATFDASTSARLVDGTASSESLYDIEDGGSGMTLHPIFLSQAPEDGANDVNHGCGLSATQHSSEGRAARLLGRPTPWAVTSSASAARSFPESLEPVVGRCGSAASRFPHRQPRAGRCQSLAALGGRTASRLGGSTRAQRSRIACDRADTSSLSSESDSSSVDAGNSDGLSCEASCSLLVRCRSSSSSRPGRNVQPRGPRGAAVARASRSRCSVLSSLSSSSAAASLSSEDDQTELLTEAASLATPSSPSLESGSAGSASESAVIELEHSDEGSDDGKPHKQLQDLCDATRSRPQRRAAIASRRMTQQICEAQSLSATDLSSDSDTDSTEDPDESLIPGRKIPSRATSRRTRRHKLHDSAAGASWAESGINEATANRTTLRRQRRRQESTEIQSEHGLLAGEKNLDDDIDIVELHDVLLGTEEALHQKQLAAMRRSRFKNSDDYLSRWLSRRRRKLRSNSRMATSPRAPKRRRTAAVESKMSVEVEELVKQANNAYLERDIPTAIKLLQQVIHEAPILHDPFHLLGLIYEQELHDKAKAVQCYFLGANLVPKDHLLWRRVGLMFLELGQSKNAKHCFRRCLSVANGVDAPFDEGTAFDLALLYIDQTQFDRAIPLLEALIKLHPGDPVLGCELARCQHNCRMFDDAIATLRSCVKRCIRQSELEALKAQAVASADGSPSAISLPLILYDETTPATDGLPELPSGDSDDLGCDDKLIWVLEPHLTNMLAEVYLETRRYSLCERLLSSVLPTHILGNDSTPLDLVCKLAIARIHLGQTVNSPSIATILDRLLQPSANRGEFLDLILSVGDSFYKCKMPGPALRLFRATVTCPNARNDAAIWVKIARCQLLIAGEGAQHGADQQLKKCIYQPDFVAKASVVRNLRGDTEARLLLSQVLSRIGRDGGHQSLILTIPMLIATNSTGDLPNPIPTAERRRMLTELQSELSDEILVISTADPSSLTREDRMKQFSWIEKYIALVQDSELDVQRVLRFCFYRRLENVEMSAGSSKLLAMSSGGEICEGRDSPSTGTKKIPNPVEDSDKLEMLGHSTITNDHPVDQALVQHAETETSNTASPASNTSRVTIRTVPPRLPCRTAAESTAGAPGQPSSGQSLGQPLGLCKYINAKRELGLTSIEEMLGWKGYAFFLETGIGIVMRSANMHRTSVELIEAILSNKRILRNQQFAIFRRLFQSTLKKLSLRLAIDGGLHRVALSYIRERYLQQPFMSKRSLETFGRILFCGSFAHATVGSVSSSLEKEALLESRAWCVRQLLQRPFSFALTTLVAHFCSLSGRWPFAVAEYTRSHRLVPTEPSTCLCLATALLNYATSGIVQDPHGTVLRGFSVLNSYIDLRRQRVTAVAEELGFQSSAWASENGIVSSDISAAVSSLEAAIVAAYATETLYNYGRALHHVGLLSHALPMYIQCLRLERVSSAAVEAAAATLGQASRSGAAAFALPPLLTVDLPQLRFCAAHNTAQILRARDSYDLASAFSRYCIDWTDSTRQLKSVAGEYL